MSEEPNKTDDKPNWRDERGLFLPGNPGSPGRPKGKTLKEWVREQLLDLNESERMAFLKGIPRDIIWRMAEGNPTNDLEVKAKITISDVLNELDPNGQTPSGQEVENESPVQDTEQRGEASTVSAQ